jgi:16S rRNA pseudouridine516 synthase
MTSKYHRLDRFISQHLQIKRKDVRLLLAQKRVSVDDNIASDTQSSIGPFNKVVVDNIVLQEQQPIYLMMNKPIGVVSATQDNQHTTALDLIDLKDSTNLHIVGRLDLNTSGLLLLTNDGRWSQALTSPNNKVEKRYNVGLKNNITAEYIQAFANGMHFPFENITTRPAVLTITGQRQAHVVLQEGRYHQIKRMFGRFRNPVESLQRTAIGNLQLPADLKAGQYRALSSIELQTLNSLIKLND